MARRREDLHLLLKSIDGPTDVYFQAPTVMTDPYIKYQRDGSWTEDADNQKFAIFKRYQVTVVDRDPDSLIPDAVEALPNCSMDRFFVANGLNHWVFTIYF